MINILKCNQEGCNYIANKKTKLDRHNRMHSGERPFPCTFEGCLYRATRSDKVKTHMLIHTNLRSYNCSVVGCTYIAKFKHHITRHIQTHCSDATIIVNNLLSLKTRCFNCI